MSIVHSELNGGVPESVATTATENLSNCSKSNEEANVNKPEKRNIPKWDLIIFDAM